MFISLRSRCFQNFSDWHTLFDFLSHSVAVAAWSGIQRVDSQMIHLSFFITWCAGASPPPNNICLFQAAKKNMFWAFIQKRQSSLPPSTARLLYFFTNLRPAGRYLQSVCEISLEWLESLQFIGAIGVHWLVPVLLLLKFSLGERR